MKNKLPKDFITAALEERNQHNLLPLTYEAATANHADRWHKFEIVGLKKSEIGLLMLAKGVVSNREEICVSICHYGDVPWWYEGKVNQGLLKKLMALPDFYPQVLPECDIELDEIHQFQELVNGA